LHKGKIYKLLKRQIISWVFLGRGLIRIYKGLNRIAKFGSSYLCMMKVKFVFI
jgi:hypothetical protein